MKAYQCPCTIPEKDHCRDGEYHNHRILYCDCEAKVHPEWSKRQGYEQARCMNKYHTDKQPAAAESEKK